MKHTIILLLFSCALWGQTIEDFTKEIKLNPKNVDAYYQRGYSKYLFEDYIGAIEDYTKVIDLDAKYAGKAYNSRD